MRMSSRSIVDPTGRTVTQLMIRGTVIIMHWIALFNGEFVVVALLLLMFVWVLNAVYFICTIKSSTSLGRQQIIRDSTNDLLRHPKTTRL